MQTGTMRLRELTIRYTVKRLGDGTPALTIQTARAPRDCAAALMRLLEDEPSEVFADSMSQYEAPRAGVPRGQPRIARRLDWRTRARSFVPRSWRTLPPSSSCTTTRAATRRRALTTWR